MKVSEGRDGYNEGQRGRVIVGESGGGKHTQWKSETGLLLLSAVPNEGGPRWGFISAPQVK